MSRHQITGVRPSEAHDSAEIRIPLATAKFRGYRDMQAVTATMGAAMTVGFCGFPLMLLYIWIMDPAERNLALVIPGAVLALVLPIFVGCATWPARQTANVLTKTLKRKLPALVISREGITVNSSNYVFGFIPWNEIEAVQVASRRASELNKDFIGIAIVVKDKNVLLRRKPKMMAAWLNMDAEISRRRQVFIPQGRITMPVEEVVEQINSFRAGITP